MRITLKKTDISVELIVSTDGARITEDISHFDRACNGWRVDERIQQQLITAANEISRFNCISDVDFCKSICDALLSDSEIEDLIESYK